MRSASTLRRPLAPSLLLTLLFATAAGPARAEALDPKVLVLEMAAAMEQAFGWGEKEAAATSGSAQVSLELPGVAGQKIDVAVDYTARPPDYMRAEIKGSVGRYRVVTTPELRAVEATDDGRYYLERLPEARAADPKGTGAAPEGQGDAGAASIHEELEESLEKVELRYAGTEAVEGGSAHVVEATPKPGSAEEWSRCRVWILDGSKLLARAVAWDGAGAETARAVMSYRDGRPVTLTVDGSDEGQTLHGEVAFSNGADGRLGGAEGKFEMPGTLALSFATTVAPEANPSAPGDFSFEPAPGAGAFTAPEMTALVMGRVMALALTSELMAPGGIFGGK